MTKDQLENKIYEWLSFEADQIRDIQQIVQTINNPEDTKLETKLSNIESAIAERYIVS